MSKTTLIIRSGFILFLIFVGIDLVYLNYRVLISRFIEPENSEVASPSPVKVTDTFFSSASDTTQLSILRDLIKEATAALTARVDFLAGISAQPKLSVLPSPTAPSVKEYYIPLGIGSTTATEWTDIPGAEAYVTPANFGRINSLYFEVGLEISSRSGRAYARLRNVTDNVGLVESEIYREGGDPGLSSSGKIPVPVQTKLYRVQLKSSLGVEVKLQSARLKIFVN